MIEVPEDLKNIIQQAQRVVQMPLDGIDPYSPMFRAIVGLTMALGEAGLVPKQEKPGVDPA